eukprot:744184-Alexandrium_andersonii.AAC.1
MEDVEPQRKDPAAGGSCIHLGISKVGSLASEAVMSVAGASCCCGARASAVRLVECVDAVCSFHNPAKSFLARCGFNPEGNVDRRPSKSSLEAAF